jgi:nicotinamidase-related amidase
MHPFTIPEAIEARVAARCGTPHPFARLDPRRTALVVVDMQRAFDDPAWGRRHNADAEQRVGELLAAWRDAQAPIVHVRHTSRVREGLFRPGTPAHEFKPEAAPVEGEPIIDKNVHSAFIATDLEWQLRAGGATGVVIAGITTDHCCSTTARMASDLGFETTIVSDATVTFDRRAGDGSLLAAELIHETALASLRDEFAKVVTAAEAAALPARAEARRGAREHEWSLEGRLLRSTANPAGDTGPETLFQFHERDGVVYASYAGGRIGRGFLVGRREQRRLEFRYAQINTEGETSTGSSSGVLDRLPDGRLRLDERWEWESRPGGGTSTLEEVAVRAAAAT